MDTVLPSGIRLVSKKTSVHDFTSARLSLQKVWYVDTVLPSGIRLVSKRTSVQDSAPALLSLQ